MTFIKKMKRSWDNKMRYRKTVAELNSLSDRELHDIGINRCDIYHIAMEEMVGKSRR